MSRDNVLDAGAIQRLLLARAEPLRRYVARKIPRRFRGALSAEDVLQDVWIAAFRTISPDIRNIDRWLTALTNSKLIDALRSARALKRGRNWQPIRNAAARFSSFGDLVGRMQAPPGTPSSEVSALEARHAIQVALSRLPEDRRQAICLRYIEGLSHKKIAGIMQRTESAVNSLLHRSLSELRECVGDAAKFFSDARSAVDPH